MSQWIRDRVVSILGVVLCLYTLVAVNYSVLKPQSALAIFIMLGMVLCFLVYPLRKGWKDIGILRAADVLLAVAVVVCFGYIFIQTEPAFERFWPSGGPFTKPTSLGDRAGEETTADYYIGLVGLLLVLEATRRSIGWIVPALASLFVLHSFYCHLSFEYNLLELPDWMLPHVGQNARQIAGSTFLQSLGVLGPAAGVMFKYVFLFVIFGAFLEMSGATLFIIQFSEQVFGRSPGGPAKVSVLGSGLMGSLSGSAVANAVTTGSFTIPMMRNSGFQPHVAGGITAAAASGGALVPPVMGAGAYMMLEFIERPAGEPQVTFLEIARAALIPAVLYYLSIFMIVHFYARRVGTPIAQPKQTDRHPLWQFEAIVFFGALGALIALLLLGFSPFKSVTGALALILVLSAFRRQLKMGLMPRSFAIAVFLAVTACHQMTASWAAEAPLWLKPFLATAWYHPVEGHLAARQIFDSLLNSSFIGMFGLLVFGLIHPSWRPEITTAFSKAAKNGISLVAASACVGIIIGIVQTTPMANDFGAAIKAVVESNLLLALIGIMVCSIVLGMGVPSVVCYLLMATLMGSLLGEMGVDPLAAHMFIFYFGMMSMVTPPVALAAYASASIAQANIMPTALAAFRFSLVGFTLPFMFVYRPELLLMGSDGGALTGAEIPRAALAIVAAVLGVTALAGGITGHFFKGPLSPLQRILAAAAAVLLLMPGPWGLYANTLGGALFAVIAIVNWRSQRADSAASPSTA